MSKPIFPCAALPDDPHAARLLGLYPQRQDGLWMQRLKVPGGRLTAEQWRVLADLTNQQTPTTPMHLTTRQDLEFHDLTDEQVPVVQQRLAEAGITSVGACGDTLRNVTVCPCAGATVGTIDLMPLAAAIREAIEAVDGIYDLPRKFKIALSCGPDCGQPWINDLGFIARRDDNGWAFTAVGAGSLGAKPGAGILLFDRLDPNDVVPLVQAAVAVFAEHGDRENRRRARLRHVRERLGDQAFVDMLTAAFEQSKAQPSQPAPARPEAPADFSGSLALTFANGDLTPEALAALGDLAARDDVLVRIDVCHRIMLFGTSDEALRDLAEACEPLRGAARPQASVVACPGRRWCKIALTDTNAMADRIRAECTDLPADWVASVSGCPNGCAHSAAADVGLTGAVVTRDGERTDAYNVMAHGGRGRTNQLGQVIGSKIAPDDVVRTIRGLTEDA